ncbi:MAG: hypothetical protein IPH04_08555 [Saprospirales bacterium]|nr:hypothetical protein [Saprospirales bacterium]
MGGLIGMLLILLRFGSFDPVLIHLGTIGVLRTTMGTILLIGILIAGLVGTSRLLCRPKTWTFTAGIGWFCGCIFAFRILLL